MEFSKEFKEALSEIPESKKDQLIFRLLRRDEILAKKLFFELIDPQSTDEKRDALEKRILEKLSTFDYSYGSDAYLIFLVRSISGEITEHVKVTSDKFGDVYLNLILVNETIKIFTKLIDITPKKLGKFYLYLINKILKSLMLAKKMDEDYWMEIDEVLETLIKNIENYNAFNVFFAKCKLDFNWLKCENIPNTLNVIIKNLKHTRVTI